MTCNKIMFDGFNALEILTDAIRLVIITDRGPRIAFWGKTGGENLLLWEPGTYSNDQWDLMGGHRVWVTRPFADEGQETYYLDDKPCRYEITDTGCVVTTPVDPSSKTERGIKIQIRGENHIEVVNFIENKGGFLYSGGVWALTCTVPTDSTMYGIPLGDNSGWDCCKLVMFRRWEDHTGAYDDEQFSYKDDMMLLRPLGRENKRMVRADRGIIAMRDPVRDILFAKKSSFSRGRSYPQDCNLAVYIGPDNFMVEMETMGPEIMIKPGESIHHTEHWVLSSAHTGLTSSALEELFYHK